MKQFKLFFALFSFLLVSPAQADPVKVPLGSVETVTQLYSYPNNCSVICFRDWTLEETVEHYLGQSLKRDGYHNASVDVVSDGTNVIAYLSGLVPESYGQVVTNFLDIGQKAFGAASQINKDGKWAYDWYFFLPHGMAMQNHKTVELLHFPPDYSLTQVQDYLISKTTDRWNEMLEINGVNSNDTPLYQTVIDLAPIAAPASAGSTLSDTYSYFTPYARLQLDNWTYNPLSKTTLPVVAFGGPVRDWIKTTYGPDLKIDGLAQIKMDTGRTVDVLGANHPSYIWYAGNEQGCDDTPEKAYQRGTAVMLQDAIASCWQARMGEDPTKDAKGVLDNCTATWNAQPTKICEMYYEQVKGDTPEAAAKKCKEQSGKSIKPWLENARSTFHEAYPQSMPTRH